MLFALLSLCAPALAQANPPERVFVSELQPLDKETAGMAALLSTYLTDQLNSWPEITALTADDAPDFGDDSAWVYLQSCPPGQAVGCAWVVADAVGASYAIGGTVEAVDDGRRVVLSILDVEGAREAVSFSMNVGIGDDQALASGVASLLLAVMRGEEGLEEDIRGLGAEQQETRAIDKDLVAKQLAQLAADEGDDLDTRSDRQIDRKTYTMDDLADEMDSDAMKPWERLDMTPGEYLQYKNSGLSVPDWRDLAAGKKFQVIVRLGGGLASGAFGTHYYGHYAIDAATGDIPEVYAWEARTGSSAVLGGLWAGFGVLPILSVEAGAGYASGAYDVEMHQQVVGTEFLPKPGDRYAANNLWFGGRAVAAFFPTRRIHPVAAGGVLFARSSALDRHVLPAPGSELPVFSNASTLLAQGIGGVEVTLPDPIDRFGMDLYAFVPVGVVIGGRTLSTYQDGGGALTDVIQPTDAPLFSGGLEVGISVRALGGARGGSQFDRFDTGL